MIKLVVALGNPGVEYQTTRHNIGQMMIEYLSFYPELRWEKKFKGLYSFRANEQGKIFFLKPLTYMNLSGESVLPLCQFFKILPEEIVVLHDELDLPFGQVVFKKGGGLAGHNGLKSIAQHLGSQNFLRIRLGIDRPPGGQVASWVLSGFNSQEKISLENYLKNAAKALEMAIFEGFEKAAANFSKKNLASGT